MAPKKNTEKPPTSVKKPREKKAPKQKLKKEKLKLRIPTSIRIKIPNKNTIPATNKNVETVDFQNVQKEKEVPAKLTKKQMTALTKRLERGNEEFPATNKNDETMNVQQNVQTEKEVPAKLTKKQMTALTKRLERANEVTFKLSRNTNTKHFDTYTAEAIKCQRNSKRSTADFIIKHDIVFVAEFPATNKYDETMNLQSVQTEKEVPAKLTKKQMTALTKRLERANEVAKLQLLKTKPEEIENEVNTSTVAEPSITPNRKRGRPPKNVPTETTDTTTVSGLTDSEDAFDMTPKKRKYVRKVRQPRPPRLPRTVPRPAVPQPTVSQTTVPQPTVSQTTVPQPTVSQTTVPQPTVSQTTVPQPTVSQITVTQPKLPTKKKPVLIRNRKVIEKKSETKKILKQPNATKLKITIGNTLKKKSESVNNTKVSSPETKPRTRRITLRKPKPDAGNLSSSDTPESVSLLHQLENIATQNATFNNLETTPQSPNKCHSKPSPVDSRKTSVTNASEHSWTKDISSSSTTSCAPVCSSDFVRIDKKMPVLSLTNIDHIRKPIDFPKELDLSSDSESSSSSFSFTPKTPEHEPSPDTDSRPCTLSEANNFDSTFLDRITATMKNFDLEIINWIGYTDTDINVDVKHVLENKISLLKEESEVIACCQRLKCVKVFSDIDEDFSNILNDRPRAEETLKDVNDFAVPLVSSGTETVNEGQQNASSVNRNTENQSQSKVVQDKAADNDNYYGDDKYKNVSFNNYDDDDTLSLFAESLTGMESSRMNSSVPSVENRASGNLEEYIPQPVAQEWEPPKITYVPTKISNVCKDKKIVCEKQRADSTSIHKDIEQEITNITDKFFENVQVANTSYGEANYSSQLVNHAVEKKKLPVLMANIWNKPLHGVKSQVFRGVCFFHLISRCKVLLCQYPHVIFKPNDITMRLVRLSEEDFIQEYMLLRNWPVLRRAYGMCFVEECKRRELTRILVEMAMDFYMKAKEGFREDLHLRVIVAECVLLYLNTVDLNTCEDLLLYSVQPGVLLCDVFMKTIADTQNFSRFKPVFIKLTKFIVEHDGNFNLDVATQILERVCILPCELPLSEALFDIVRQTDPQIFDVSMMRVFEKQLASLDKELYAQFLVLKKDSIVNRPVLSNHYEAPLRLNPEVEPQMMPPALPEKEARYTSPDTTNLDSMNKAIEETSTRPSFTRPPPFNIKLSINNSPSKGEESVSRPSPNFQTWKGQSVFDKIRGLSPQQPYRPPLIKRRIHQQTGGPSPALATEIKRRNFPAGPVQTFFDF